MRITLINPVFPLSLWDFTLSRDLEGGRYPHPPLALPTVAALTPAGHQVRLVDENVEELDLDTPADLVGITGYHVQQERVFWIADQFRRRGAYVALGGPLVDASTRDECLRHADAIFLGEAEYTWPRFLDELKAGRPGRVYEQSTLVDLHDSPAPRYDLLRADRYSTGTIETSRGCPFGCEFCEIPTRLGKRSRTKTVDQVMTEVRSWHALGADSIFFIDDHFIGNRNRALALLEELGRFARSVDHALYFSCQFSLSYAEDDELLELMYRASFRRTFLGVESPRKANLKTLRKLGHGETDLVSGVRRIQSYNITVWGSVIVGFDGDDTGVFAEHYELLQRAGVPVVMVGLLQALPGTPLFERLAREGRVRDLPTRGIRGPLEGMLQSNVEPKGLSRAQLVRGFQGLIRELYEYEPFGERLVRALRGAKRPVIQSPGGLSAEKAAILARVLRYYLLTTDLRRIRMFLSVLLTTARHAPEQLENAFLHLVVYKHLRLYHHRIADLPLPDEDA
ncbi:MAG: radical SAM protein [bacterium]